MLTITSVLMNDFGVVDVFTSSAVVAVVDVLLLYGVAT